MGILIVKINHGDVIYPVMIMMEVTVMKRVMMAVEKVVMMGNSHVMMVLVSRVLGNVM